MMHCQADVAPEHQGLVQKALHREAVEHAIELQVPPLRVTQVDQAGDDLGPLVRQLHLVDGGVVLHFGARLVGHAVATCRLVAAQAQLRAASASASNSRLRSSLPRPASRESAASSRCTRGTVARSSSGSICILVAPLFASDLSLLPDDRPHGIAADVQAAADLAQRHPFLMQLENGITLVRIDHETPPSS